jgi:hypothetical protein
MLLVYLHKRQCASTIPPARHCNRPGILALHKTLIADLEWEIATLSIVVSHG